MPVVRRFWIEFDRDREPAWPGSYVGVTGYGEQDCLAMVADPDPVVLAPWVSCTGHWCRNETDDTYRVDVIFDCGRERQRTVRAYLPAHRTSAVGGDCGSHRERCSTDRERWCDEDNPILGIRYDNVVVDNGPIPPWPFGGTGSSF